MKTVYSILALCAILLISSCYDCRRDKEKKGEEKVDEKAVKVDSPRVNPVELSPNKLVVRFPDGMSEDDRQDLRDSAFVTNKSSCPCASNLIELWEIDTTKIDIEHATSQTTSTDDGDGVRGDRQFTFPLPSPGTQAPSISSIIVPDVDPGFINILGDFRISANNLSGSSVNIAIVDTGYDFKEGMTPFLYDTSNTDLDCGEYHVSGWNFVNNDADIRDTHRDGHGTFVTETLMRELNEANVPYTILPVKAFDDNGKGSYWNVVCAFNYVKEVQARNGNLHIVNASFGYGLPVVDEVSNQKNVEEYNKKSILASLITELENNTIIVASAGNDTLNIDEPENAHFPSGFTTPKIISVGGYALYSSLGGNVSKTIKGNYGPISVDLLAPYQHLFLPESADNLGQDGVIKQGTSYGAPFTSAILAKFISDGNSFGTPTQLKQAFLESDFILQDQNFTNKVDEGRYIESDAFINNPYMVVPVHDNQVLKIVDQ